MRIIALSALALLTACSGGASDQAEAQADKLDNAAEQSTPEAAAVLEDQADAIRANGVAGNMGEPGSTVQNAMSQAGQAQVDATPAPAPQPKPQSQQALPHGAEKGDPPEQTQTR